MEFKHGIPIHLKSAEEGTIEAIVSVFGNVDYSNERVLAGAFTKSLERKLPKGVWMHDQTQPVAKTLEARELPPNDILLPDALKEFGGLYVKGKFNLNTQRGAEAYSDIKEGIVDEFSIGYNVDQDSFAADGARELKEIFLIEWSPVLIGANKETALLSVKSNLSFDDDVQLLDADIARFIHRMKARIDMRVKEGRQLSGSNLSRLATFIETVKGAMADIEALLESASPQKELDLRVRQLRIKYEQIKGKLK